MKILKKEWFIWTFWKKEGGVVEKRGEEETKSMPHAPVEIPSKPLAMEFVICIETTRTPSCIKPQGLKFAL